MKTHRVREGASVIPRRQFLVLGSAAVVGAVATDMPAQLVRSAFGGDEVAVPLLSVGYFDGAVDEMSVPSAALGRLVAADRLRSGDTSLVASGVRLRVHGFFRTAERRNEPVSLGLNALYRVSDLRDAKVPVAAWSYAWTNQGENTSSDAPFTMHVAAGKPLELTVSARGVRLEDSTLYHRAALLGTSRHGSSEDFGVTEAKGRSIASLSIGNDRGTMKLRPGVYFLALRSTSSQKAPDWRAIRPVVAAEGAQPVLAEATVAGYQPVGFDYLMVTVDRA